MFAVTASTSTGGASLATPAGDSTTYSRNFLRSERNSRGTSPFRGAEGPLAVSDGLDPHAGHEAFLDAARQQGFDAVPDWEFNGLVQELGAGYVQKNILDGERHSASDAYLRPALDRPNLAVVQCAHATGVVVERGRAVGVSYLQEGVSVTVRAAQEVVLCGGVIESPKLLLLSGIGPADHLRAVGVPVVADLAGVGANLQDHLKISIRWNGRTTLPPSSVTAGLFAWSSDARRTQDGRARSPDLQFYVGRGLDQPDPAITITASLVRPASRGGVRLRSDDPLDAPIIRTDYLNESDDLAALAGGVRLARDLGRSQAYDRLRADETIPGPDVQSQAEIGAFIRAAADTIYHAAGTCRMGIGDGAVVDAQLRVRGIGGLRVADASIMPDVVNATTHAACVMIGEKASDLIRS